MFGRVLENLRARPREERVAIAAWCALVVVAALFLAWAVYFFNSIRSAPAPDLQAAAEGLGANGLSNASEQLQQAYGSTTQFIQTGGSLQLEEIATSTE